MNNQRKIIIKNCVRAYEGHQTHTHTQAHSQNAREWIENSQNLIRWMLFLLLSSAATFRRRRTIKMKQQFSRCSSFTSISDHLNFYYFLYLNWVHFDAGAVAAAARVFVYIFIRDILLHISTYWLYWSEFLNHRNWIWSQHERREKKTQIKQQTIRLMRKKKY